MDGERFDRLVESLTRSGSRRGVLRTLSGAILGAAGLGALARDDAAGKDKRESKRRGGGKRKKKSVRAEAVSCCSGGSCIPGPGKNLYKCCFEGQNLAGKNFKGANVGSANFSGATLTNANFSSANLGATCFVDADLTGAKFNGANTSTAVFCRTTMPNGSVNNSGCDKGTSCCQTCVEIGEPRCAIGGGCCGGAECTGTGDGVCTCPQAAPNVCGGVCVDFQSDESNCGACGVECPAGETCEGGVCRCGGQICESGLTCCNGQCVNLRTDENNCTECGNVCPQVANAFVECGEGVDESGVRGYGCTYKCGATHADCDGDLANGCETRIYDDPNNCGRCGRVCPAGEPRCCGCTCHTQESTTCSTCQELGNARLIRRR